MKMSEEELLTKLRDIVNSLPNSDSRWKLWDLIDEIEGVNV